MKAKALVAAAVVVAIGAYAASRVLQPGADGPARGQAIAEVSVPDLGPAAAEGRRAFAQNCAGCHGEKAEGRQGMGPPLVHPFYEPNHHADASFVLAARRGVRAHHWKFGNMPPVEGVTDSELQSIIAYVRTLQKANGIY